MAGNHDWRRLERVKLVGGRLGIILGLEYGSNVVDLWVMLDDYVRVRCRSDQATAVRHGGETVEYDDSTGKVKLLPIEAENIEKLHAAIWHDHWARFGEHKPLSDNGPYARYWSNYQERKIVPMPKEEDIRSAAGMPKQMSMF